MSHRSRNGSSRNRPVTHAPRRGVLRDKLLSFEPLEPRVMLDGAPDLVVGRTPGSFLAGTGGGPGAVRQTITYTVYNEQSEPADGVLLTTTLAPGVTLADASAPADRDGSRLAWSLGTIEGFGRASITVTVTLATPALLPLDLGARAFATVDARAVSDQAPPLALLAPASVDPARLAATPDADALDPFVAEKAAELDYDARRIFEFLHAEVAYESYAGSVRGARGTLWSGAGNALDVASLGVALLRASGIPARYAQGTLSPPQAQALILRMFPEASRTVGYVPPGAGISDPANDPTLLAETEAHAWIQLDAGSGLQDADPLIPGAALGQAFATPTATFDEVPDALRAKTRVQLVAEVAAAAGAFGGGGPEVTTVLDQTFNDVALVGRPITVGNLVNSSRLGGLVFATTTNTYSPYLFLDDEDSDTSREQVFHGTDYQEVLTNFPFGSRILTGLFLDLTLSGPGGPPQAYRKALVDRIGFAARQAGGGLAPPVGATDPPIVGELDQVTINALPGLQSPRVLAAQRDELARFQDELEAVRPSVPAPGASGPPTETQTEAIGRATRLERQITTVSNENLGVLFALASDRALAQLETGYLTRGYYTAPRLIVSTSHQDGDHLTFALDLVRNDTRDVTPPGQAVTAALFFEMMRGYFESTIEGQVVSSATGQPAVSFTTLFAALTSEGGRLVMITRDNLADLDGLALSATAKARIAQAVQLGKGVLTPTQMVTIADRSTVGWLEIDLATGHLISVMEDGGHQALVEYVSSLTNPLDLAASVFVGTLVGFGNSQLGFLGNVLGGLGSGQSLDQIVRAAKVELVQNLIKDLASVIVAAIPIPGSVDAFIALGLAVAQAFGPLSLNPQLYNKPVAPEDVAQAVIGLLLGQTLAAVGSLVTAFQAGLVAGSALGLAFIALNFPVDPPVAPILGAELATLPRPSVATARVTLPASLSPGSVSASVATGNVSVAGQLDASWSTAGSTSGFLVATLAASGATVRRGDGTTVGSGAVALSAAAGLAAAIAGTASFRVKGTGRLAFYGPAGATLGVGGDWSSYAATVAGNVTIALTTDGLTLNGKALPAGTYLITTSSATLAGRGPSTSPSFAGSATIQAIGATVDLGPGTGTATVGGTSIDPAQGLTLTGYGGTLAVTGNAGSADAVTLAGNARGALAVSADPPALSTDQLTPATFRARVPTILAGDYTLTARAPAGWTVAVDPGGQVTVTPAPGLQGGTFPVRLVAESTTDPGLVAQAVVNVTVTPTSRGFTLAVAPDPLLTVPFQGAEVPTAFRASIRNTGAAAETYRLSFSGLPSGFTLAEGGTTLTVPAGQLGSVGLYLLPTGQLPAPGTPVSFTVTATSTTDPALSQSQVESFVVPQVHGLSLSVDARTLASTPGAPVSTTLRLSAVGNVAEDVALGLALPAGLSAGTLAPVTLQPGQSTTRTLTLTPGAAAALGRALGVTVTATFGDPAAPRTTSVAVDVIVRSPETVAVFRASDASAEAGNVPLATSLADLARTLAQLQAAPADAAALARVRRLLGDLGPLLAADPALAPFVARLQPLATAAGAGDVAGLLAAAPGVFGDLEAVLVQESRQRFSVTIDPGDVDLQPGEGKTFTLRLANTGDDPLTLALGVGALPAGVTASPAETQVTLAPGEVRAVPITLDQSLVSATIVLLRVTARASLVGHSALARISVQGAPVDVVSVAVDPASAALGAPVSARVVVANGANAARAALAHLEVLDQAGAAVATPTDVPVGLVPDTAPATLDLGTVPTAGLAAGLYTLRVSLRAPDGTPIPGRFGQAPFFVGTPLAATVSASPIAVPPGTSTVTTTIQVTSDFTSSTVQGDLTQLLPGVTASANGAFDGRFQPYRAIDGSQSTSWLAASGDAANLGKAPFLDVNLPSDATVTRLQVFGNQFGGSAIFAGTFQLFDAAGQVLFDSGVVTLPAPGRDATVPVPNVAGVRRVRFTATADEGDHPGLSELKVFGSAPIPVPPPPPPPARLTDPNEPPGGVLGATVQTFINLGVDPLTTDIENTLWTDPVGFRLGTYVKGGDTFGGTPNPAVLDFDGSTVDGTIAANANRRDFFWVQDTGNGIDFGGGVAGGAPSKGIIWDLGGQANQAVVFASVDHGPIPNETLESTVWLSNDPDAPDGGWTRATLDRVYLQGWSPDPNIADGFVGVYRLPSNQTFRYVSVTWGGPSALQRDGDNEIDAVGGLTSSGLGVNTVQLDVRHQLPPSASYAVDPASLSPTGATLTPTGIHWSVQAPAAGQSATFQLVGQVAGLAPGETRAVSLGTTVTVVVNAPGAASATTITIPLPPVVVAAQHVIDLDPPARASARGASATFDVVLSNPLPDPVTYTLATAGLDGFAVALAPSVTVGPGQSVHTPLSVTVPADAEVGTQVFTVLASSADGARDSVVGQLAVSAASAPASRAVALSLTPVRAVAGQGTAATYRVVVTNTGDLPDTYALGGSFPAGFAASFAPASVAVAPGSANARVVLLTLTPPLGTPAGDVPFTVTARSTTDPSASATADGAIGVVARGVRVSLNPPAGAPGDAFALTVTNTGTTADTFDLALQGPAALSATLSTRQVTLAPGASRVVPIATVAVGFAIPGRLDLTAVATSRGNPAVRDDATAALAIGPRAGLATDLAPAARLLPVPGTSSFLLMVRNTGNVEDSYEAVITGTSGPVSATLIGLDGTPTRSIPLFRLPGLAVGALLIDADLAAFGQGTVTVRVRSLSHPAMVATRTATVSALAARVATTTRLIAAPDPSTFGRAVTLTAIVTPASGQSPPTGSVVFTIDGRAQPPVPLTLVAGQARATLATSALAVGRHTVLASYSGQRSFGPSTSAPARPRVDRATTATSLLAVPSPATAGRPVTLTAIVTGAGPVPPTGLVTFKDGDTVLARIRLGGSSRTVIVSIVARLSAGMYALSAAYGGDADLTPSTGTTLLRVNGPPAPGDGPRVVGLDRFGIHVQPTSLVLTFSVPLDPQSAEDPGNYAIVTLGGPGRGGSRVGRRIGVLAAVYDPRALTVTLSPAERLDVHNLYRLTVNGTTARGVRSATGRLLDGRGDGVPGSDFVGTISRQTLVVAAPPGTSPAGGNPAAPAGPLGLGLTSLRGSTGPRRRG